MNREGPPRIDPAAPGVQAGNDADHWGDLPLHVRQRFRNQGGEDFPTRYRDWIDTYYRRLNRGR